MSKGKQNNKNGGKQAPTFAETVIGICKKRAAAKPEQKAKWGIERAKLATALVGDHFAAQKISVAPLSTMALYAVQKVRKLAHFATGQKATIDPASMEILRAAKKLAKDGVTFTPELQRASLSKGVETTDAGVTKLPRRGNYTIGTAASQSQTTRQALEMMGLASVETYAGKKNCLVVDFEHETIVKLIGKFDE